MHFFDILILLSSGKVRGEQNQEGNGGKKSGEEGKKRLGGWWGRGGCQTSKGGRDGERIFRRLVESLICFCVVDSPENE